MVGGICPLYITAPIEMDEYGKILEGLDTIGNASIARLFYVSINIFLEMQKFQQVTWLLKILFYGYMDFSFSLDGIHLAQL